MVTIFGNEIDIFSLIPALFGALLSAYNWWKMRRPADIQPNRIITYGMIASGYQEGMLLCIPLIFTNEGAKKGLITEIQIGFQQPDGKYTYLDLDGKARLQELDAQQARLMDWEKFENNGYVIQQPMYPIVVEADTSEDVYLIARTYFEDHEIPLDTPTQCKITVKFDRKGENSLSFPFYLAQEDADRDDQLAWLSPNPPSVP